MKNDLDPKLNRIVQWVVVILLLILLVMACAVGVVWLWSLINPNPPQF